MKLWRMAFRVGDGGYEMWPTCFHFGVAAITYGPLAQIDLSKYPQGEPKALWAQLSSSQKYSLRQVAYVMERGDIIYAKQGANIVGKGIVKDSYQFDANFRIIDTNGIPWAHQIPVEWQSDFVGIQMSLGDQQRYTVRELHQEILAELEIEIKSIIKKDAIEGQIYTREVIFRKRNGALIQAKKTNSDYCCEVCGFSFEKTYGSIGREYIIAHHIEPLSERLSPSNTKLDDIALLCANCHAMVHSKNPPLSPVQLKKLLFQKKS